MKMSPLAIFSYLWIAALILIAIVSVQDGFVKAHDDPRDGPTKQAIFRGEDGRIIHVEMVSVYESSARHLLHTDWVEHPPGDWTWYHTTEFKVE